MLSATKYRLSFFPLLAAASVLGGGFLVGVPEARAACPSPASILDLNNWKQTLPAGAKKKPVEILPPALGSFSHDTYFRANSRCTGVVFRAPVNGVTTSGSGYPRSELREMESDGKKLASWSTTSGTHTLVLDEAITAVPKKKKHVVAGQIHDADDDVIVIRLEYPKLFVDINGKTGPVLDARYALGKRFSVKFVATDGKIQVYYNGGTAPVYTLKEKGNGHYFKVGAYTQSNCEKEKDCSNNNYGEVVVYKLLVDHQAAANAAVPFSPPIAFDTPAEREETVRSNLTAYRANHDGFREHLLEELMDEVRKTSSSVSQEEIARAVYTLLPDILG